MALNSQFPSTQEPEKIVIDQKQSEQIVGAILSGKYSWACVLLLRFIGYNPLHYLPYTTYIRLLKENTGSKGHARNL